MAALMEPAPHEQALRVLYVWDADYPWDVRVEKSCAALTAAGHIVHVVARNRARRAPRELRAEATVHRMPAWPIATWLDACSSFPAFFNPRWLKLAWNVARHANPDVIVARDLPLCPTAIWVGAALGIPVLHDMAEHYPAMIQEIYDSRRQTPIDYVVRNPRAVAAVERYCLRHVERIVVVTDEMRDRLARMGVTAERVDVVSNTPSRERAREKTIRPKRDGQPLELAYLGILEVPRGLPEVIEAAAILRDSGVAVRVRLIGGGRDAAMLQALAREHGVLGREVEFLGFRPHAEALEILRQSDVGLLPHRRSEQCDHTIPNKLFDYMAAGLPIVAADAQPIARVVREARAGEVFASRDAHELAACIARMRDDDLRARFAANGRRSILTRYNWQNDSAIFVRAVERTAGARARRFG